MLEEIYEIEYYMHSHDENNIENLKLYQIMYNQLKRLKSDESIVFFIPFPINLDGSSRIYNQFATDILSLIYKTLKKNDTVKSRQIYAIYPCLENEIVIRLLNKNQREYFKNDTLEEYINYIIRVR